MEFVRQSTIQAPADYVFDWHARPGAVQRLVPPWENVRLLEETGGIQNGGRKVFQMSIGPLKKRWVAEHRNYEHGRQFEDVQLSGPFAEWVHTHTITPTGPESCTLEDRIHYRLPLGPVGKTLGGAFSRSQLNRMFAFRHAVSQREIPLHYHHREVAPMKVLISGSSGLVGSHLTSFLTTGGHEFARLTRSAPKADNEIHWDIDKGTIEKEKLEGFDAVVHLAGENIAKGRWTEAKKKRIRDSRVEGTRLLTEALASLDQKPKTLYCASAIGFYGDRGDAKMTEADPPGEGFLADVCQEWEAAADPARQAGIRTIHGRFGVVLSPEDGALAKMMPIFKLGLGGRLGSGKMYWSWVGIDDVIGSIHHTLTDESMEGPVNVTAPEPLTNAEFTKVMGKVLSRPTIFPAPAFAVKLGLGEMAEALLLSSIRVIPEKLSASSYEFAHPTLEQCLRHLLGKSR